MRSLQREEAIARRELLTITGYDVSLDLRAEETFASRTVIDLESRGGETFLDLKAVAVHAITLDGVPLPVEGWAEGRFPLSLSAGTHRLEVDATMPFRSDGEGLHRAVDPADGRAYVYQMSFMSAAPTVFACFDQPDLKAPYTLHVTVPADWNVTANAAGHEAAPGQWEFEPSRPLSTYFVTLVAGPYHRLDDEHDGIPLGLLCRASMADALDHDAEELFTLTKQCFDEFHRLFGIRYPFGKYDQAWVPDFNAGAMENPGCVTFREALLFTTTVTGSVRRQRATTLAHEMAHQWFGNLVTPQWWDDLWLNESFAEYMGNRVAAEATRYTDSVVWASVTRKNWGLSADAGPSTHPVAGNGATDADAALQDFDGISYSKGHAVLTQLADRVGDDVFFTGVRDHFERHRFGNATMSDLFDSWERAGAGDLESWTTAWLRTAGLDRIELDRDGGALVLTPAASPAREHDLTAAIWTGADWEHREVRLSEPRTPFVVPDGAPVVLDATDTAWADLSFDDTTLAALPDLMSRTTDPVLGGALWVTAHNGVERVRLDPDGVVEVIRAGLPHEQFDYAVSSLAAWAGDDGEGTKGTVHEKLLPVVRDADAARAALHTAFLERATTADPGSELRLAAYQGAIGTAARADWLRTFVADLPEGVVLDGDLRWRVLRRLTSLGDTDLDELDRALAEETDAKTRIHHAWCHARLPEPEAKARAWQRFSGEVSASNYEIAAAGGGFWQSGQEALVAPYVERYFTELPGTAELRAGWLLADAALFFYPVTVLTEDTLARTDTLLASGELNPTLHRVLVDAGDTLRRRLATRARYGG